MANDEQTTVERDEFNKELVRALDDLASAARHHEAEIKASFARSDEVFRRRRAEDAERVRARSEDFLLRETPADYGNVDNRFDRIERALIEMRAATKADFDDIRRTMATKVELEALDDKIKMIADGYQAISRRLDHVAELLKMRVVMP
jgi:archaellum component FlaC